jgi:hypothetical protein
MSFHVALFCMWSLATYLWRCNHYVLCGRNTNMFTSEEYKVINVTNS